MKPNPRSSFQLLISPSNRIVSLSYFCCALSLRLAKEAAQLEHPRQEPLAFETVGVVPLAANADWTTPANFD